MIVCDESVVDPDMIDRGSPQVRSNNLSSSPSLHHLFVLSLPFFPIYPHTFSLILHSLSPSLLSSFSLNPSISPSHTSYSCAIFLSSRFPFSLSLSLSHTHTHTHRQVKVDVSVWQKVLEADMHLHLL